MSYSPKNKNGISNSLGSQPMVLSREINSGSITTQNLNPTGVATPNSSVEIDVQSNSGLSIQVVGTYTGALSLQGTLNGTNWITIGGVPLVNISNGSNNANIASATQGIFQTECSAFLKVRITALAAVTGTANITLFVNPFGSVVDLGGAIPTGANTIGTVIANVTGYPTAANPADAVSNTNSTTFIKSLNTLFNGTTWDRNYSNFNITTADTGAKTATFNGATQTNFNFKGAYIWVNVGAVSGTTPTMNVTLQWSPDNGTNWINIDGATGNITTTNDKIGVMIYPTQFAKIFPGSGTIAMGVTQYMQLNMALPRTWRLLYTIGGTTPSFTITSVNVSYIL